jgi:hypothetical protein
MMNLPDGDVARSHLAPLEVVWLPDRGGLTSGKFSGRCIPLTVAETASLPRSG